MRRPMIFRDFSCSAPERDVDFKRMENQCIKPLMLPFLNIYFYSHVIYSTLNKLPCLEKIVHPKKITNLRFTLGSKQTMARSYISYVLNLKYEVDLDYGK